MRKSQFTPANDQAKAEFIHNCDTGKKPYAKVEEISEELRIVSCPLCGHKEYHQFIRGRSYAPKITLRQIASHKGGRTARLDVRCAPEIKLMVDELANKRGISRDDLIEELIKAEALHASR